MILYEFIEVVSSKIYGYYNPTQNFSNNVIYSENKNMLKHGNAYNINATYAFILIFSEKIAVILLQKVSTHKIDLNLFFSWFSMIRSNFNAGPVTLKDA